MYCTKIRPQESQGTSLSLYHLESGIQEVLHHAYAKHLLNNGTLAFRVKAMERELKLWYNIPNETYLTLLSIDVGPES